MGLTATSTAHSGGGVWFTDENTAHVNALSGKFGAGVEPDDAQMGSTEVEIVSG